MFCCVETKYFVVLLFCFFVVLLFCCKRTKNFVVLLCNNKKFGVLLSFVGFVTFCFVLLFSSTPQNLKSGIDIAWINGASGKFDKKINIAQNSFQKFWKILPLKTNQVCKVHIFWESHKILQNLPLTFVICSAKVKISQNFVAFSEYMNFKILIWILKWAEKTDDCLFFQIWRNERILPFYKSHKSRNTTF